MKKVEAIVQPMVFDAVKTALIERGFTSLTILEVRGHGRQKGHVEIFRGQEYKVDLLPKVYFMLVVHDEWVSDVVKTIKDAAFSGELGDGKIFVSPVDHVFRIRNEERDDEAI